jgi:hypothetical protein
LDGTTKTRARADEPPEAREAWRKVPDCPPDAMDHEAALPHDASNVSCQEGIALKSCPVEGAGGGAPGAATATETVRALLDSFDSAKRLTSSATALAE